MYLYVLADGSLRQVEENPTVGDYLAVAEGLLHIVKWNGQRFVYLVKDENKFYWVPVRHTQAITHESWRFNQ